MTAAHFRSLIEREMPACIALRRTLHRRPERSHHEFVTARTIYSHLRRGGCTPRLCAGGRAVRVDIGTQEGPSVVLRADLDALPVQERTGLSYASRVQGVMHACGHDMHAAALAGVARLLQRVRHRIQGRVVCIFQHAEESTDSGANALLQQGCVPREAAMVFGLHVSMDHPTGTIGLHPGYDTTALTEFAVTVTGNAGHSGHAAAPGNALMAAHAMVERLTDDARRSRAHHGPYRLAITSFHSGTVHNVIDTRARFGGTLRTRGDTPVTPIMHTISDCIHREAEHRQVTARTQCTFVCPAVYNDPDATERIRHTLQSLFDPGCVIARATPAAFSEDFSLYQQYMPGVFAHLGVRPPGADTGACSASQMHDLHSSSFAPDEAALAHGMRAHCAAVLSVCPFSG
jgi:amidohydrolase